MFLDFKRVFASLGPFFYLQNGSLGFSPDFRFMVQKLLCETFRRRSMDWNWNHSNDLWVQLLFRFRCSLRMAMTFPKNLRQNKQFTPCSFDRRCSQGMYIFGTMSQGNKSPSLVGKKATRTGVDCWLLIDRLLGFLIVVIDFCIPGPSFSKHLASSLGSPPKFLGRGERHRLPCGSAGHGHRVGRHHGHHLGLRRGHPLAAAAASR